MDMETKKESNGLLALKIIGVIIVIGIIGYVTNHSSQNSGSSDVIQPVSSTTQDSSNNTTSATPPTTLSNTEMCKKHAQLAADSAGSATSLFYSVQSYHYSNLDSTCYFELHYQMDTNFQGNETSQVYSINAESMSLMKAYPDFGESFREADCIVPETNSHGATTSCKYYGLVFETKNNFTFISNKYGLIDASTGSTESNPPPMSYSDYEALVQKRMSN